MWSLPADDSQFNREKKSRKTNGAVLYCSGCYDEVKHKKLQNIGESLNPASNWEWVRKPSQTI